MIDGKLIAAAHRGEEDHAERIAIRAAKQAGADLSQSVIYTTLEPCTAGVRRRTLDSCADRLVAEHPRRVVIGMHDPNLDVCGKGFLRLQNAGVPTKLFPWNLTLRIKALNEEFIRAQQSLGIRITYPQNGAAIPTGAGSRITLRGTWINPPSEHDYVIAMVQRGANWWFLRQQLHNPQFELPGHPRVSVEMEGPPKGIDKEDEVEFNITNIVQ